MWENTGEKTDLSEGDAKAADDDEVSQQDHKLHRITSYIGSHRRIRANVSCGAQGTSRRTKATSGFRL